MGTPAFGIEGARLKHVMNALDELPYLVKKEDCCSSSTTKQMLNYVDEMISAFVEGDAKEFFRNLTSFEHIVKLLMKKDTSAKYAINSNLEVIKERVNHALKQHRGGRRKRTSTKRASSKRTSTKRASSKRASSKRASSKRASSKRASSKRASSKRASSKRASSKRASSKQA